MVTRGTNVLPMSRPVAFGAATWPAAMIVWGPGVTTAPHRHHCVQLTLVLQGSFRLRRGPDDAWRVCRAALVRPDAVHQMDTSRSPALFGFFEPESSIGAALCQTIRGDMTVVGAPSVARWRAALGLRPTSARIRQWVNDELARNRSPVTLDPRVETVLTYLRAHLDKKDKLSLQALAAVAVMSPSRLMHLFTESLGVPLRPYIRWLRLQQAACELIAGTTMSVAAHSAGFADAAHLTRTFRRTFGTTPSSFFGPNRSGAGVSLTTDGRGGDSVAAPIEAAGG